MTTVQWSLQAKMSYLEIQEQLVVIDLLLAKRFALDVLKKIDLIRQNPRMGRMVPEKQDPLIREVFWKSYRIIYRIHSENVEMVLFYPTKRLFDPRMV